MSSQSSASTPISTTSASSYHSSAVHGHRAVVAAAVGGAIGGLSFICTTIATIVFLRRRCAARALEREQLIPKAHPFDVRPVVERIAPHKSPVVETLSISPMAPALQPQPLIDTSDPSVQVPFYRHPTSKPGNDVSVVLAVHAKLSNTLPSHWHLMRPPP